LAVPKALILRTAGTNCDVETAHAFTLSGAVAERVHVNRLIEDKGLLDQYQILAIPGGFSYGDDIAAGKILANELVTRLEDALQRFKAAEKLIIGICNGFQVMVKAGLLPGFGAGQEATLANNDSGKFEDRWVFLKVRASNCVFLRGLSLICLPVAHGEGKFIAGSSQVLSRILSSQGMLCYVNAAGLPGPYPVNPNGSQADIAGISDPTGRILGLMPHPERHVVATQHPRWTRLNRCEGPGDGLAIFQNAVKYFS